MKIEVSIDLLKDFFDNCNNCKGCKYQESNYIGCIGTSCTVSKVESLIEKSKLVLDFDLAILELEKQKKKCTEKQIEGLLFAIEKLEEIKKEYLFMK